MKLLVKLHHSKNYYAIYEEKGFSPIKEGEINGRNVREIAISNGYTIKSMVLLQSFSYDISKYCLEVK